MVNPFKEVNWNPDTAEKRTFAKSLVIGFPIVGIVLLIIGRISSGVWDIHLPMWVAGIGVSAGIIFWIIPQIAKPFYLLWYCLACCIGIVLGNVLLGIVFYIVVTILGLIMRILGRDPLQRKIDKNADTYWIDVEKNDDPTSYYRQS
jgi:hypothetical protein